MGSLGYREFVCYYMDSLVVKVCILRLYKFRVELWFCYFLFVGLWLSSLVLISSGNRGYIFFIGLG